MKDNGKKLLFLGIASVLIAITTTTVSLITYHNSGDIYLDRSRPGFLPDEDEIKNKVVNEKEYKFSEDQGIITNDEIDEYIIELEETQKKLDAVPNPYSPTSISDEALNILVPAE